MKPSERLVAVVEDDPGDREAVVAHLEQAGFRVAKFAHGSGFRAFLESTRPDVVILDRGLPDGDGLDICREMKQRPATAGIPVIILTGLDKEMERVVGLEVGADDYVTKPFSGRELVARVKARLRRTEPVGEPVTIEVGGILKLDLGRYRVTVAGEEVELTPTEFRVLRILAARPGWVFSRDQILDELWGGDKEVIDRTVDLHITNLRHKLGKAGSFIKSVRGVGYKLEA